MIKTSQIAPPFGEQEESTELNPSADTQQCRMNLWPSSPASRRWLVLIWLVLWTVQHRWSMANMVTIITTLWSSRVASNCFPTLRGSVKQKNRLDSKGKWKICHKIVGVFWGFFFLRKKIYEVIRMTANSRVKHQDPYCIGLYGFYFQGGHRG